MEFTWARATVGSGGVELAVFEGGVPDGPVVVLVHGWPDTHHLWTDVAALLARRFRVVAYDTRGMGESGHPGSDEGFALPHLAADLRAVADAVSPDRPVHVVGHDWGSVQVWEAVCEPWAADRIASFTSMSGPNVDHLGHWVRRSVAPPTPGGLLRVLRQGVASAYVPLFASPLGPPALRRVVSSRERWAGLLERIERVRPEERHHAPTLPDDAVNGLAYYRANIHLRSRPRERRTTVPVLLLVQTRDPAIRPDNLEESGRWVEHLERRELPYGHWVALSRPDLVAREVTAFVDRVTAG
ncbi:alpha/beta fold hydrolase [Nocardioides caldifontis]|uniref:alpha/beta fold hydrolase n=1 Tax=Nocardioides caldifontis TaxID=2588938 RepID=UPI0011DF1157|nr:alpha/beta fold hydrolase [Nocardioides caldifontis]